jgi:hypothetical protein
MQDLRPLFIISSFLTNSLQTGQTKYFIILMFGFQVPSIDFTPFNPKVRFSVEKSAHDLYSHEYRILNPPSSQPLYRLGIWYNPFPSTHLPYKSFLDWLAGVEGRIIYGTPPRDSSPPSKQLLSISRLSIFF